MKRVFTNGCFDILHRGHFELLKYVDEVRIFEEDTPYNLIKNTNADIIVKGGDYTEDTVVGNDLCQVIIFEYIDGYSTTKALEKM